MHVQKFLSIPFGTGKLMSRTPYRKISSKQSMLATLKGVCIRFFFNSLLSITAISILPLQYVQIILTIH